MKKKDYIESSSSLLCLQINNESTYNLKSCLTFITHYSRFGLGVNYLFLNGMCFNRNEQFFFFCHHLPSCDTNEKFKKKISM